VNYTDMLHETLQVNQHNRATLGFCGLFSILVIAVVSTTCWLSAIELVVVNLFIFNWVLRPSVTLIDGDCY